MHEMDALAEAIVSAEDTDAFAHYLARLTGAPRDLFLRKVQYSVMKRYQTTEGQTDAQLAMGVEANRLLIVERTWYEENATR